MGFLRGLRGFRGLPWALADCLAGWPPGRLPGWPAVTRTLKIPLRMVIVTAIINILIIIATQIIVLMIIILIMAIITIAGWTAGWLAGWLAGSPRVPATFAPRLAEPPYSVM